MQWVFDKRPAFGDVGVAPVARVERRVAAVANRSERRADRRWRTKSCWTRSRARGPRKLLRGTVVREPRATFSLAPGQPPRPGTATAVRGLFLAGDWIDTGLPATIESAVRSGHRAS